MQETIKLAVKTSLLNDNKKHLVRDSENQLTGEMARELKYGCQTLLYSDIQNQAFFKSKKQKCQVNQIKKYNILLNQVNFARYQVPAVPVETKRDLNKLALCRVTPFVKQPV